MQTPTGRQVAGWITVENELQNRDLVDELRLMFQAGMRSRGLLKMNEAYGESSFDESVGRWW